MTGAGDPCPISRTVRLVGGKWTPLIVRELLYGRRRFDDICRTLRVSRATLSDRLQHLEASGVIERRLYEQHPPRHEYWLTDKGRALWPVLAAMWAYGSDWTFDEPTPGMLIDESSGREIKPVVFDETTGRPLDGESIRLVARRPVTD